jgi:hypothetical protein
VARVVKIKNTGATGDWQGQTIDSGAYYTIDDAEIEFWRRNEEVFEDVGNGRLVVNDGTSDFTNTTQGWEWVLGEFGKVVTAGIDAQGNVVESTAAPVTNDGETHTIQSNMANVTGNKLVNWTMTYTLGADTSIDERFVVPNGETASIEFIQGYSSAVPFSVELNWYRGTGNRINPAINPKDYAIQAVNGAHSGGDTVITLKPGGHGFAFNALEINKRYAFLTSSGTTFIREVTAKNVPSKTVTLGLGIPSDLSNGDDFALVDRPIARLGGDAANALMDFEVAPSFRGDGTRYLELVIKNESLTDSGDVFAVVNGWTTSTISGTIPGSGGDAGVDEDA